MPGVFDPREHDWRRQRRRRRLEDRAVLGRLRPWRNAGMLETAGRVIHPDTGVPPGGVVSPVCANVAWHEALDRWCETGVTRPCRGEALLSRYAADGVGAFRCRSDADWWSQALPQRLGTCTLVQLGASSFLVEAANGRPA